MDDLTREGALLTRQEFGSSENVMESVDTAATSAAAQAKAMVEARYIMALRKPRDYDDVRLKLMKECRRPSFAHNKSALYNKPIGGGVEGLGIRFVEVALRCLTNVLIDTTTTFEDAQKELLNVSITDLETNLTYNHPVKVSKTVERSRPLDDGSYISVRKNSYGKDTYTVPATDDDLLNKRGALISKAIRTLGSRVIPGDLQDEAQSTIRRIREDRAAQDPDAERKAIADAFMGLGVRASEIAEYLGHALDSCSPAELVTLRGYWGAIRDGETTWKAIMESAAHHETIVNVAEKVNGLAKRKPAEWPKWDKERKAWFDADGVYYDEHAHSGYPGDSKPRVNGDGSFKAKRGYAHRAKRLAEEVKTKQESPAHGPPAQALEDDSSKSGTHTITPANDKALEAAGLPTEDVEPIDPQAIIDSIREAKTKERCHELAEEVDRLSPGAARDMCSQALESRLGFLQEADES